MHRGRVEAFSDGVIAILITIMVLELKVPRGVTIDALRPLLPVVSSYVLSFVFLGIYWSNHHHMLYMVDRVNGKILWANLHLLFWLSLVPFVTAYLGQNGVAPLPTALYGAVLLLAGIAYTILQTTIIAAQGPGSKLKAAVSGDVKGKMSIAGYTAGIALAFVAPWVSITLYVVVAGTWLVPDRRIERRIEKGIGT
jgi:uncharacterized membrane protein